MTGDRPRGPEDPDDVDEEFARIIAGMELEPPDSPAYDREQEPEPEKPAESSPEDSLQAPGGLFDPRFSDHLSREEAQPEPDDDGDHFVPPTPPPTKMSPLTALAWAGAIGSPLCLVIAAVINWYIPRNVAGLLMMGFAAGVVYLIVRMSRDPDDDWDDGAVL